MVLLFIRAAPVAQGIEHRIPNPGVAGSNPAGGAFLVLGLAMLVSLEKKDGFYLVKLEGELVFSELDRFEKEVIKKIEEDPSSVIIDVSSVSFVDSSGLGALVKIYTKVRLKNHQFVLVGPSEEFKKVLEITNLLGLINIAESLEEAEALISQKSS